MHPRLPAGSHPGGPADHRPGRVLAPAPAAGPGERYLKRGGGAGSGGHPGGKDVSEGHPLILYDASPGIACPVIETLEGSDFCLLVTESTPFGLHDLRLAVEVAETLGIPAGIVINRSDGEDAATVAFAQEHNLPILMTIPFSREIAAVQNRGGLIGRDLPGWEERFTDLFTGVSP